MKKAELERIRKAAVEAAEEAGKLTLRYYRKTLDVREKARSSLVTEVDLRSEALIRRTLAKKFPSFEFRGEESGESPKAYLGGPCRRRRCLYRGNRCRQCQGRADARQHRNHHAASGATRVRRARAEPCARIPAVAHGVRRGAAGGAAACERDREDCVRRPGSDAWPSRLRVEIRRRKVRADCRTRRARRRNVDGTNRRPGAARRSARHQRGSSSRAGDRSANRPAGRSSPATT